MFARFIVLFLASAFIVQTAPQGDPPPPTPTAAQENDDPCPQYSRCGIKGRQYWTTLMKTLASPAPVDRTDGFEIYKEFYGHSREKQEGAGQEVVQDLLTHGISIDDFQRWHVFSLNSNDERGEHAPYQNLFDTKDGVIIGTYNWRSEDSQKKLQWSEIVYQTYLLNLEPGQSISALQAVIKTDVVNPGTWNVARSAYESIGLDVEEDEQWRKWTLAETPYFFYGFLGTDNVKGVVWLLNDHPVAIGRKVITEIWTRSSPHFDIWMTLGPYDPSTMQTSAT